MSRPTSDPTDPATAPDDAGRRGPAPAGERPADPAAARDTAVPPAASAGDEPDRAPLPAPAAHPRPSARSGTASGEGSGSGPAPAGVTATDAEEHADTHPADGSAARPPRWRRQAPVRLALALSGWVALAATALPGGWPPRWIPVLAFVVLGPGCALLLPRPAAVTPRPASRLEVAALAAPVSLSVATLTATGLFLAAAFSATVFLASLAALTTVAAFLPALPLPAAAGDAAGDATPGAGPGTSR